MKWPLTACLTLAAVIAGFGWGVGTVRYGIFPYSILAGAKNPQLTARRDYFRAYSGHADIVVFGDSILRSVEWAEELPGRTVLNRAIENDTSADALARVDDIAKVNAAEYVILLGANDLMRGEPAETTARNVQRIVDQLPGDKLILGVMACAGCEADEIARLNTLLGRTKGARFAAVAIEPVDLVDGTHLGAVGMNKLAETVRQHIHPQNANSLAAM